jgi:hypothetical protein
MTISARHTGEPITLERARQLNGAMFDLALEREGIRFCSWDRITLLREASLVELAQAGAVIKEHEDKQEAATDGSRSFSMVCDDRLVAAIYAFLHFAVPPAHRHDDDDYLILRTKDNSGYTAFLMCGVREIIQDEEAEAA